MEKRWVFQKKPLSTLNDHASMPSKSSLEEPVARNTRGQVGNDALMHSWRRGCPRFSSCMISAGMDTRWPGVQQNRHLFTAMQAHMARLTSCSLSASAGAVHAPVQPVNRMSLKPPGSASVGPSFLFPPTEIPAFLYTLLLFGVVVLLSIYNSDVGIWGASKGS